MRNIYQYWIAGVAFALATVCAQVAARELPGMYLEESFENIMDGDIGGQNGWVVEDGSATVQAGQVSSGLKALRLQAATVSRAVSNTANLWVAFDARMDAAPTTVPAATPGNSKVTFYVNTNRYLVVQDGPDNVETDTQMPLGQWVRFSVYSSETDDFWNLAMNGTNVADRLRFTSEVAASEFVLTEPDVCFVDEICISEYELADDPVDTDGDGCPDWWELKHFGGITNSPGEVRGQGGLTPLEAYIAGVDPDGRFYVRLDSPASENHFRLQWDAAPFREYIILRTTSLAEPFIPCGNVVWPDDSFVDTNQTGSAFYRISVRIH